MKNKVKDIKCVLRVVLAKKEWQQKKLSAETGLDRNYISDIVCGRVMPGLENALIIAKAVDKHVDDIWLIEWEDGGKAV